MASLITFSILQSATMLFSPVQQKNQHNLCITAAAYFHQESSVHNFFRPTNLSGLM